MELYELSLSCMSIKLSLPREYSYEFYLVNSQNIVWQNLKKKENEDFSFKNELFKKNFKKKKKEWTYMLFYGYLKFENIKQK